MLDFLQLLPHSKKDSKLDTKSDRGVINEVADMAGCSSVIFFEVTKQPLPTSNKKLIVVHLV